MRFFYISLAQKTAKMLKPLHIFAFGVLTRWGFKRNTSLYNFRRSYSEEVIPVHIPNNNRLRIQTVWITKLQTQSRPHLYQFAVFRSITETAEYHFVILRSITMKVEYNFAIFRSTTEKTESCRTCNSYVYIAVINWCRDKDGLNCWRYVDAKCLGFYEDWARENCPYRCGYCPSMNRKTKIIGAYICILAPTQVGQGYSLQIKIYRSKPNVSKIYIQSLIYHSR